MARSGEAVALVRDRPEEGGRDEAPGTTYAGFQSRHREADPAGRIEWDEGRWDRFGARTVELPGKPYGLRAGDAIIFTAKLPVPGQERIKNRITATVIDTSRHEDKITLKTNEHEPREVLLDTSKFDELSLSYAVHINKAQGITAETSGILIGGWQTDKEHAYVTVSRAREQTQIYVSREDLGEKGLDIGAVERLSEKMKRSRAQQATITKKIAERDETIAPETTTAQQTAEHDTPNQRASTGLDTDQATQREPRRRRIEDDHPIPSNQLDQSRDKVAENAAPRPAARTHPGTGPARSTSFRPTRATSRSQSETSETSTSRTPRSTTCRDTQTSRPTPSSAHGRPSTSKDSSPPPSARTAPRPTAAANSSAMTLPWVSNAPGSTKGVAISPPRTSSSCQAEMRSSAMRSRLAVRQGPSMSHKPARLERD
jgi:hypothetical protein